MQLQQDLMMQLISRVFTVADNSMAGRTYCLLQLEGVSKIGADSVMDLQVKSLIVVLLTVLNSY